MPRASSTQKSRVTKKAQPKRIVVKKRPAYVVPPPNRRVVIVNAKPQEGSEVTPFVLRSLMRRLERAVQQVEMLAPPNAVELQAQSMAAIKGRYKHLRGTFFERATPDGQLRAVYKALRDKKMEKVAEYRKAVEVGDVRLPEMNPSVRRMLESVGVPLSA